MEEKKSGLKSDVKRKLISASVEVLIGLAILIYSLVTGSSLYTYAAFLFLASGAFSLVICGIRIFTDKKAAQKEAIKEENSNVQTAENVVEVKDKQGQTQQPSQDYSHIDIDTEN